MEHRTLSSKLRKKGFKIEEVRHDCRQCVTWYQIETDDSIIKWKVDSSDVLRVRGIPVSDRVPDFPELG